jgi:hypothetical protein
MGQRKSYEMAAFRRRLEAPTYLGLVSRIVPDGPNGLSPWTSAMFSRHFTLDTLADAQILRTHAIELREMESHLFSSICGDTPYAAIGE